MNSSATNAKMVRFVPELASEYAKYPMKQSRWLDPKEKDPSSAVNDMCRSKDTTGGFTRKYKFDHPTKKNVSNSLLFWVKFYYE